MVRVAAVSLPADVDPEGSCPADADAAVAVLGAAGASDDGAAEASDVAVAGDGAVADDGPTVPDTAGGVSNKYPGDSDNIGRRNGCRFQQ